MKDSIFTLQVEILRSANSHQERTINRLRKCRTEWKNRAKEHELMIMSLEADVAEKDATILLESWWCRSKTTS